MVRRSVCALTLLALAACDKAPPPVVAAAPPPPPVKQGFYKVGAPYQTGGVWYYPSVDLTYDETGIASIFAPSFREAQTANGETFDQTAVTAAHKTLPMPSVVQVTNMENGRQIQVRINDRGSYEPGRVIQLTSHAGELLGFPPSGLARVRVQVMPAETIQVASLAGPAPPSAGSRIDPLPQASPRGDVLAEQLPPPASARSSTAVSPRPALLATTEPSPRVSVSPALPTTKPSASHSVTMAPRLSETVRTVPVGQTQLFILGGAFTRADNAERVRGRLLRFGRADIVAARHGRETLYRARLGPLGNIDSADKMLSRVIASGLNEAKIVVD